MNARDKSSATLRRHLFASLVALTICQARIDAPASTENASGADVASWPPSTVVLPTFHTARRVTTTRGTSTLLKRIFMEPRDFVELVWPTTVKSFFWKA